MIVPMKKILLFCLEAELDRSLRALRELGVLHVEPVQAPRGESIDRAREQLETASRALGVLEGVKRAHVDETGAAPPPEEVVSQIGELIERKAELSEQRIRLLHDEAALLPYGDFDPALAEQLGLDDVSVRFYHTASKAPLAAPPDGTQLLVTSRDASGQYFVVVGLGDVQYDAQERTLPKAALSAVREQLAEIDRRTADIDAAIARLAHTHNAVARFAAERQSELHYAEVERGAGRHETIAYVGGFCPANRVDHLRECAAAEGWGLNIADPEPDDAVPTLIRYPAFVRPIKAVFDFLQILPGYREADISAAFLLFFSVFFGMLVGDAGYGALLLVVTLLLQRKTSEIPGYAFALFHVLAVCAIAWGVVTGNYFGIAPDHLPAALRFLMLDHLTNAATGQDNIIRICFLIGAVHHSLAHIWNAVAYFPNRKWLAELGWMALVWIMFYGAKFFVLAQPMPNWWLMLFVPGLVMVVLFMTEPRHLKRDIVHHFMLPLDVISCFIDVVSYIRLFAVGMAAVKVAMSFNDMAAMMAKPWVFIAGPVILLVGHGINIALCALGILVHGVRLNTLEFSLHRNMQWSGKPYRPFEEMTQNSLN